MQLLTKQIKEKLLRNSKDNQLAIEYDKPTIDFKPVVKFFNPIGGATWLITEMDEHEMMFGLCDLGPPHGSPELGSVHLKDLSEIKLMGGHLGIERDRHWSAKHSLNTYYEIAKSEGRIVA